jgi:hypothetical protein
LSLLALEMIFFVFCIRDAGYYKEVGCSNFMH